MEKEIILKKVTKTLLHFGATEITLFGSYARGDETKNSDLDIIVEFKEIKSLLELCHIIRLLEEEIGISVDLVTKHAVNPDILPFIQPDMKVLYPKTDR